jgi:hypothetical protein
MKHGAVSTFVRWFLLGVGILFFASMAVAHARICGSLAFWPHYAEPLAYFILSGAATIGLLAVAMSWVWFAVRARRPRARPS